MKHKSHGEQLREMGLLSLERRDLSGGLVALYNCAKGDGSEVGVSVMALYCPRGGSG